MVQCCELVSPYPLHFIYSISFPSSLSCHSCFSTLPISQLLFSYPPTPILLTSSSHPTDHPHLPPSPNPLPYYPIPFYYSFHSIHISFLILLLAVPFLLIFPTVPQLPSLTHSHTSPALLFALSPLPYRSPLPPQTLLPTSLPLLLRFNHYPQPPTSPNPAIPLHQPLPSHSSSAVIYRIDQLSAKEEPGSSLRETKGR